jgi:hypothetical protein
MPGPDDEVGDELAERLDALAVCTVRADGPVAVRSRAALMTQSGLALGAKVHNDILGRDEPLPT